MAKLYLNCSLADSSPFLTTPSRSEARRNFRLIARDSQYSPGGHLGRSRPFYYAAYRLHYKYFISKWPYVQVICIITFNLEYGGNRCPHILSRWYFAENGIPLIPAKPPAPTFFVYFEPFIHRCVRAPGNYIPTTLRYLFLTNIFTFRPTSDVQGNSKKSK